MSIQIWMAEQYDNTHENRMAAEAIEALQKALPDTDEKIHVVCNFSVPGFSSRYRSSIDMAIIKPGGMIIVELKDYKGPVDYGDEGEWYCELISGGIKEIKGGNNGRNPFRQVADYRLQCRRLIEKQQLSFLVPEQTGKRQFNARNWVSALVLFPNIPEGTRPDTPTFEKHRDSWFHLVRMESLAEAVIQQMSGRNNWLIGEEVEKFIATVLQAKPATLIGNTPTICSEAKADAPDQSELVQGGSAGIPDTFNDLVKIHSSGLSLEAKVLAVRDVFIQVANKYAKERAPRVTFTSLMTKVRYLCEGNPELYYHVDRFRYESNKVAANKKSFSEVEYKDGFRAVCEFAQLLHAHPLPLILSNWVTTIEFSKSFVEKIHDEKIKSQRMVVEAYDDQYVTGQDPELGASAEAIKLDIVKSGEAFRSLHSMLYEGAVLNLVTPTPGGTWAASEIVLEPDRLLSPSRLGEMLEFANPGLRYILTLFENTDDRQKYFLRGNLANQFLADVISDPDISYDDSRAKFFCENALSLTTAGLHKEWSAEAKANHRNINQVVREVVPKAYGVSLDEWLIEIPFISPTLGLSGRMDLIHFDPEMKSSTVFELKSGKWDTFKTVSERRSHRLQCAFYGDMLFSMMGIKRENTKPLIYYAADVPDWQGEGVTYGKLFHSTSSRDQVRSDIQLRNSVIDAENMVLNGRFREQVESVTPESFCLPGTNEKFWTKYQRPEICRTLGPIQSADNLSKAFFYRFVEFLMREEVIARTGGRSLRSTGGYARAWLEGLGDRQLAGTVLWSLEITNVEEDKFGMATTMIFDLRGDDKNMGTSIRVGDSVYLYESRDDDSRNIANSLLFAGHIEALSGEKVIFVLDNPQQKKFIYRVGSRYALEAAFISGKSGYKGAFSLLIGNERRRDLVLNRVKPEYDEGAELVLDLPDENDEIKNLMLRIKQAKDFFLLLGPPGTGKTSYAMKLILNEEMCAPDHNVLLLAYTNRAVDEICKMLEARKPCDNYLRIGSKEKCDEKYTNRLVQNQQYTNRDEVKEKIDKVRIIVGTISSITAENDIFKLKKFSLAILDEASQVLEPQIMSVLCGQRSVGELLVDKFVFVGDDKQLPAVVQQTPGEAAVSDASLQGIGLTSCRQSIFERLRKINKDNPAVVGHLRRHWRMHPLISEFCNEHFYEEILVPGNAKHQLQENPYPGLDMENLSGLGRVIASQRLALFPIYKDNISESAKVNGNEARRVAEIIHILRNICGREAKDIGVVVPFRNQIAAIRRALVEVDPGAPAGWSDDVVIDTIERYQGSERDVILFSTVISKEYQCELLSETENDGDPDGDGGKSVDRKLNVAVSRAKEQFFVIGDPSILGKIPIYDELMEWIQKRGMVWTDE